MNRSPVQIDLPHARRIVLQAQGLHQRHPFGKGINSVKEIVEHLGYVQIDTISVVERAHHHVFWSRNPAYRPQWIEEAQFKHRSVFEYWSHAAAYLPMKDYRFSLPVMEAFQQKKDRWPASSRADMKKVMDRIRSEGPLMSRHFDANHKGGTWWDWKPAKWALQRLYLEGKLMVSHREGFQRVYDLPERILPFEVNTQKPSKEEYYSFLIQNTLRAQGIASRRELFHLRHIDHRRFDKVIHDLLDQEVITALQVENDKTLFTLSNWLDISSRLSSRVHILSPFDNLVIWRKRMQLLFGFDYTIECYLPVQKRKFGYFVLPVLYRDMFAGRLDLKADRKTNTLIVLRAHWENTSFPSAIEEPFENALSEFADFNQCDKITWRKRK